MNEIKDTSGPVANSESEKKMLEKSKDDHMNEETAEVELSPLIDNPLVKTNSGIQGETFVKLTEDIARSDEAPQDDPVSKTHIVDATDQIDIGDAKTKEKIKEESEQLENGKSLVATDEKEDDSKENHVTEALVKQEKGKEEDEEGAEGYIPSSEFDSFLDGDDSGTEDQQSAFMKEIENFYKEKNLEFKAPKFYGEGLNCLKLWRQVTKLGGYDKVTSCKLWRQVGESFKPPKTCTTVSWTFRIFYEKALLEYEKHKIQTGELQVPISSAPEPIISEHQVSGNQSSGSGRARRDAAARAMQGWHSQRLLGNGEVGDPIIKDKSSFQLPKREKHLKGLGLEPWTIFCMSSFLVAHICRIFQGGGIKRKKASGLEHSVKFARTKDIKQQTDSMVFDVGTPADWVKINVQRTLKSLLHHAFVQKDCFEVYALVPGLLREEVHVQSDPAGRLVVSGEPEQPDNPWGVTPFKKVITLPSRIDPHKTSAVVTLHGQLFVRAPFENSDI